MAEDRGQEGERVGHPVLGSDSLSPSSIEEPYVIRIVDEQELDFPLEEGIRTLLCACFPDWAEIFRMRRVWYKTPPIFSVLAIRGNRVIGHVGVVVRSMTTTWNFRHLAASIQGVAVAPEYRSQRISLKLLAAALEEAKKRGFPFAILFCKEPLVPFYAAHGWKLPEDHIVMRNEQDLPISMRSNCPMYRELAGEPFPEGPIDVY